MTEKLNHIRRIAEEKGMGLPRRAGCGLWRLREFAENMSPTMYRGAPDAPLSRPRSGPRPR